MISADTSAVLHFLHGFDSPARAQVRNALLDEHLVLPPVVIAELLSGVQQEEGLRQILERSTAVPLHEGHWERVGATRRTIKSLGLRCNLADALVAQTCMDADIPLIAGDSDFRHFVTHCGLKLAV